MKIIKTYHDSPIYGGHAGQRRLYAKIRSVYFWKNMSKDIAKYVKTCSTCQKNKPKHKTKEAMVITDTPEEAFNIVSIDTIGPMNKTINNYRYALTLMCNLTKYLIVIPIPNKEATTIAKAIFENCILTYGPMKKLMSDRGTEFVNEITKELFTLLKIDHVTSTAYHHETVGAVERNHRVFNEYLRSYINEYHDDWDEYIKYFAYCYNLTPHTSFELEYSPFELLFGRKPITFECVLDGKIYPVYNFDNYIKQLKYNLQRINKLARNHLLKAKENCKMYYDRKNNSKNFIVNDKVLLTNESRGKFNPVYNGPYIITKIDNEMKNAEILDINNNKTNMVHLNRLVKYFK